MNTILRRRTAMRGGGGGFDWEDFATKLIERKLNDTYVLPSSITTVGSRAFAQAASTNLFSLELPSSVTSIANDAFNSAQSLINITIPASVTSIGNNAFAYCSRLATMIMLGSTPPTITSSALGATTLTYGIYVPNDAVNTYKTAQYWSSYASRIFSIKDLP